MSSFLSLIRELKRGKSLGRTLQNLEFANIALSGKVLDVAGGNSPSYKRFMQIKQASKYIVTDYNIKYKPDICFDAGRPWPIADKSFDKVLLINCLYIFPKPQFVIDEIARVLIDGGKLIVTAPFILHETLEPTDYYRFTSQGIRLLIENSGMKIESLTPYGERFSCVVDLIASYLKKLYIFFPIAIIAYLLDQFGKRSSLEAKHPAHFGFIVVARK